MRLLGWLASAMETHQHYCQAYGVKSDDELIWKVVEHETITQGGEICKVQTVRKKQIAFAIRKECISTISALY